MARAYNMTKPRGPRGEYATRLKTAYAAIVARLAAGASSRDVAREFECDKDTANAIRRRYGREKIEAAG